MLVALVAVAGCGSDAPSTSAGSVDNPLRDVPPLVNDQTVTSSTIDVGGVDVVESVAVLVDDDADPHETFARLVQIVGSSITEGTDGVRDPADLPEREGTACEAAARRGEQVGFLINYDEERRPIIYAVRCG